MKRWTILTLAALFATASAAPATAESTEDLTNMVEIMRDEGVIDEAQYSQMRERAAKRDAETQWWERLTFSGDMRVRYEYFAYETDAMGNQRRDRGRARYRARLRVDADVNEHIDAVIRIATGQGDSRSTNQTLGNPNDFGTQQIWIDRAYMVVTPFAEGALPGGESGYLGIEMGRMDNPFHWSKKISPDYLLWDRDIGLEGAQLKAAWDAATAVQLYLNTGYYTITEANIFEDVGMLGAQVGADVEASETITVGARFSYFGIYNADDRFLDRGVPNALGAPFATAAAGNTNLMGTSIYGMTDDGTINVVEASAYLAFHCFEDWPVTVFGNFANNLSAQNLGFGKQDLAWMVGFQGGDKKKYFNAGFMYGAIQADAFPAQFIDSDFTDGRTNREGLTFWVARQILANTDLKIESFYGDEIETASPLFDLSTLNARRWRVRADIQVKF